MRGGGGRDMMIYILKRGKHMKYVRLLRVKHYIKNGLVFLPLFFAVKFTEPALLWRTLLAFAVFCLLSSAVYVFNDLQDADKDRQHPEKCKRPIACGAVSRRAAWGVLAVLLAGAAALNCLLADGYLVWLVPALYLALNVAYSLGLKNIPILDIAILTSGFLLRVLYGSAVTGIEISGWLYLTVISLAFYMSLGKRRGELRRVEAMGETRPVLKFYSHGFLEKSMLMCVTLGIVFYSLWTVDDQTIARVGGKELVWTVPLVILIFFKYSLTVEGKESDGDPVEVLLRDKLLLLLVAVLGLVLVGIVYF